MTALNHAVVWIDHREARVYQFDRSEAEEAVVRSESPTHHLHHKANTIGSGNAAEDKDFFRGVAAAVAGVGKVLVVGPSSAKTEFVKYAKAHEPAIAEHIAGVETVDHPSDKAVLALARSFFSADRQVLPRSRS